MLSVILFLGCGESASTSNAPRTLDDQLHRVEQGLEDKVELERETLGSREWQRLQTAKIRSLTLDHCRFALADLESLPKLESLRVEGTTITAAALQTICRRCPDLVHLNLPTTRLTDDDLRELASLTRLELLRIGSPLVTDAAVSHLCEPPQLRFLILEDVPITDEGLEPIAELRDLESLYLNGSTATGLTDEGISRLLVALPKLHFHINDRHHRTDPNSHPH